MLDEKVLPLRPHNVIFKTGPFKIQTKYIRIEFDLKQPLAIKIKTRSNDKK